MGMWMGGGGHGYLPDEKRPLDRRTILRLLAYGRPHARYITLAGAALLVVSAMGILQPLLLKEAIDRYMAAHDLRGLVLMAAAYGGSYVVAWIASYWQAYWMSWAGQNAIFALRQDLYTHVQRLSLSFFDRRKQGELMSRLVNDINAMSDLLTSGIISVVNDAVVLVGIMAIMLVLDAELALITFLSLPLMLWTAMHFRGQMIGAFREVRKKTGEVNANLQESLSGVRVTQSFVREAQNARHFDVTNRANMEANVRAIDLFALFIPAIELVSAIGTVLVLTYGGFLVLRDSLTLGGLVAFLTYVTRFFQPIRNLSQIYNQVQGASAAAERAFEILDERPTVPEPALPCPAPQSIDVIRYEGVDFAYGREQVLTGIDLEIRRGETIAFVGPTGAGKTTMVNLLCRFYDPVAGRLTVNGTDLRQFSTADWRKEIGIVLQDTFLFSGTIADNIRYGRLEATEAEIEAAARAVGADRFITALPNGYAARVGERGLSLSSGQKQLVAFARALLRDPAILILDEATSSVDLATEAIIQDALQQLLAGRIAVVIAHRLSTIQRATRIVVLEGGRIAEVGSHAELIAEAGPYKRLVDAQFRLGVAYGS